MFLNQKKRTHEIVVCKKCEGRGYVIEEILTNYHRGEYDYKYHPCPRCKSSGRMNKVTTEEETPYVSEVVITPAEVAKESTPTTAGACSICNRKDEGRPWNWVCSHPACIYRQK